MPIRPKKRILHIASHTGNIGDNISHIAYRSLLGKYIDVEYTDVEIRQYYRNAKERFFDNSFIELANSHDSVLIGGGALLLPEIPESSTGTTIDVWTAQIRNQLRVPIVFNAVGCHSMRPPNGQAQHKLAEFLTDAADDSRFRIHLRSDGSEQRIKQLVGESAASKFTRVPDPGIAAHDVIGEPAPAGLPSEYLAVNLAGDSNGIRYGSDANYERFASAIRRLVADSPLPIVLIPHIAQDFALIGDTLRGVSDLKTRRKIWVAGFGNGSNPAATTVAIYRCATGILATRFHGVVPNLPLDKPLKAIITAPNLEGYLSNMRIHDQLKADIHQTDQLLGYLLDVGTRERLPIEAGIQQITELHSHIASIALDLCGEDELLG